MRTEKQFSATVTLGGRDYTLISWCVKQGQTLEVVTRDAQGRVRRHYIPSRWRSFWCSIRHALGV